MEGPRADGPTGFETLLADCVDRAQRGDDEQVESLLAAHPEHADGLRSVLGELSALDMLGEDRESEPERIGRYRIVHRIGSGGMGVVYLAIQEPVERAVALKVIQPTQAGREASIERFRREAQAVARIDDPRVVTLFDFGEADGVLFAAMEFVPGRGLDELLDSDGPLAIADAVALARDVAAGLAAAHRLGIVHRDVKPSNVRITPDGRAKLLDFGLARDADGASLTRTGTFLGSLAYTAPEQARQSLVEVGPASDVYSLGATLHHLLTGSPPRRATTAEALLREVLDGQALRPRLLRREVSVDLDTIVRVATDPDPTRRYADAGELAADLDALVAFRAIRARPPGILRRMRMWSRRNLAASVALAAVLLAALAVPVALQWSARERAAERSLRSRDALTAAGAALDRFATLRVERDTLAAGLQANRQELLSGYRPPEVWDARDREVGRLRQLELDLDGAIRDYRSGIDRAEELVGPTAEAAKLQVRFHLESWRSAVAQRDTAEARRQRALVERLDEAGRHASELAREGRLTIRTEPAGAAVDLLRIVDLADHAPDRPSRMLPWPAGGWPREIAPGAVLLRVVADRPPLRRDDLLFEVAGHPVHGVVLTRSPHDPERLEELLTIDGRPARDNYAVSLARFEAQRSPGPRTLQWIMPETGTAGAPREEQVDFTTTDLEFLTGLDLARREGTPARAFRPGVGVVDVTTPAGLDLRLEANPLLCGDDDRLGVTPIADVLRAEGNYVARVQAPNHRTAVVSLRITAGEVTTLSIGLAPTDTAPPGFVAFYSPAAADDTPLWIQEHEVTCVEYLEFLNDPANQARIDEAAPRPVLIPRDPGNAQRGGYVVRDADGTFRYQTPHPDWPVYSVCWLDAQAYAAWRTTRAAERAEPFRYRLPTLAEYRSIADSVAPRRFPYGDVLRPTWTNGQFSRPQRSPEDVMTYPMDMVLPGIFDLGGGMSEWCADGPPGDHRPTRYLYGANYFSAQADELALGHHFSYPETDAYNSFGFRLVAERVGKD